MSGTMKGGSAGLQYLFVSRLIHQPGLLRRLADLLKRRPGFARLSRIVSERDSAMAVFHRQWSFTTTQAPNMRAGDFVIGMDASRKQHDERAFLQHVLPSESSFGDAAAAESRRLTEGLLQHPHGAFDLVNDYMVHVAWAPLEQTLGKAAASKIVHASKDIKEPKRELFSELRAVGAQLIIGGVAPRSVRDTADRCAASLNRRVENAVDLLGGNWSVPLPGGRGDIARNAVGLMWVGHPATVQAGALCLQELLARRDALQGLAARVGNAGSDPWSDVTLRAAIKAHVLELLRLRPPFPLLTRNVPRETWFLLGEGVPPGHAPAGSSMTILVAGALADTAGGDAERFCPARKLSADHAKMMFGYGERSCIAKDHVVEVLASALIGLLRLPRLRYARLLKRIEYDGPTIKKMKLRYGARGWFASS